MQEVQALKIEIQTFNEDFSTQKAKEFAKEQKMTESEFKLKKDELFFQNHELFYFYFKPELYIIKIYYGYKLLQNKRLTLLW